MKKEKVTKWQKHVHLEESYTLYICEVVDICSKSKTIIENKNKY